MVKPLGLAVALGLTLDISGAMHVYGIVDAQGETRETIMATVLLVLAGLWLLATPANEKEESPSWLACLPLAAAALSISDIFSFVSAGWSPTRIAVLGGGTIALLALALRRAPAPAIAGVAFALGVALRAIHIRHVPLEPARGDMLPLVQQALGNLGQGRSPYATYSMPWELPLTYLPLTWLAYAPAFVLGLDLRWTNIGAEIAILGAALFVVWRTAGAAALKTPRYTTTPAEGGLLQRHVVEQLPSGIGVKGALDGKQSRAARDTALLLWAWLFVSPTIIHWDMVTSAPIGWAAIAWALALVVVAEWRWIAVALGLAAATTPLIVVFVPLIVLCWWRENGLAATVRHGALAALVAAAVLLPWVLWAPGAFWEGNVRWFNDLQGFPRLKWETEQIWAQITGYSGQFWKRGTEQWLKPIQLALVLVVAAIFVVRGASRALLLRHATAAFVLFMLFNPVLWPYLYNPALVAALLAIAEARGERRGADGTKPLPEGRPAEDAKEEQGAFGHGRAGKGESQQVSGNVGRFVRDVRGF